MPEEAIKEIAAAGEQPPGGGEPPRNLASQEFFFLLQRIDRLDEKLTERINRLEDRVNRVEEKLSERIDSLRFWAIGAVVTIIAGFAGVIVTLILR